MKACGGGVGGSALCGDNGWGTECFVDSKPSLGGNLFLPVLSHRVLDTVYSPKVKHKPKSCVIHVGIHQRCRGSEKTLTWQTSLWSQASQLGAQSFGITEGDKTGVQQTPHVSALKLHGSTRTYSGKILSFFFLFFFVTVKNWTMAYLFQRHF